MKFICLLLLSVVLFVAGATKGSQRETVYSVSTINHEQELSSSAVLTIFKDSKGLMWFGTYDGLNCWDGQNMEVYRSDFAVPHTLNNNVINKIRQADAGYLWVTTHIGINRFSPTTRQATHKYVFNGDYEVESNYQGNTWVVGSDWISYYNTLHQSFVKYPLKDSTLHHLQKRAFVVDNGELWLFHDNSGDLTKYTVSSFGTDSLQSKVSHTSSQFHLKPIQSIYYQNGFFCFTDEVQDLYLYDVARKSKIFLRNIASLTQNRGKIVSVTPFYDDVMIAFLGDGLVRMRASKRYEAEMVDRNLRIFSLYKDPTQGILWMATDGKGVVSYAPYTPLAESLKLSDLSPNLSRQVRCVLTDQHDGLWLGTKGDGLVHIAHYLDGVSSQRTSVYSPFGKQTAPTFQKWAKEYQIYSLARSRSYPGFWIGTGNDGLCFYSYVDDRVMAIAEPSYVDNIPLSYIHAIYEHNDTTLYLATSGSGFRKVILDKASPLVPKIKSQRSYQLYSGQRLLSMISSMTPQGDSLLWVGNRGLGIARFDIRTNDYQTYSLQQLFNKSVDDVLCLNYSSDQMLHIGTTSGLVSIDLKRKQLRPVFIGKNEGLFNDMIHGIAEDSLGILWLSTNRGVVKYNSKTSLMHNYYNSHGLEIGEFSDGAYYKCPFTGNVFFGGVDGVVRLVKQYKAPQMYNPDILLRKLYIDYTEVNIGDYYTPPNHESLRLKGSNKTFMLEFIVPDYLSGKDITYSYKLDGYDRNWSVFSLQNKAQYANVPAGKYVFKVMYNKDVDQEQNNMLMLPIEIVPYWYQSRWFLLACILLVLVLVVEGYVFYEKLREKNKKQSPKLAEAVTPKVDVNLQEELGELAPSFICATDEDIDFVAKVIKIIKNNIDNESLSTTFLAEQTAMSQRQFYRRFKKISEIPPGDLIKNYRIERSAQLLVDTKMSIQDIAAEVGIFSRSYFHKEFTRKYNMTPKDYREQFKSTATEQENDDV